MIKKYQALGWYAEQLKQHKGLFAKAVGAAVVSTALLEIVIPYCMAVIFELVSRRPKLTEYVAPVGVLVFSASTLCVMIPYRQSVRRRLQTEGHDALMQKITRITQSSPTLALHAKRSEILIAIKDFFSTWELFLRVIVEVIIPLLVGVIGLGVILALQAPIALVPLMMMLLIATLLARKIGHSVDTTWEVYKHRENDETVVLIDMILSAQMSWLTRVIGGLREKIAVKRRAAMEIYIREMARYNLVLNTFTHGFRAVMVVAGIGLIFLDVSVSAVLLLWFYTMGLGERFRAIFGMNELLGVTAVNASALIVQLDGHGALRPALILPSELEELKVRFTDVVVELEGKDASDRVKKTTVRIPDLEFGPGMTLLAGRSGCGKTTTLRTLSGCQTYASGSVTINGKEVSEFDVSLVVFYSQQADDPLLETPRELFGDEAKVDLVEEALYLAHIPIGLLDHPVTHLSPGERRRIFLALLFYQVLCKHPSEPLILGLDEPTNHLDELSVKRIIESIRELAERYPKLVIVVVTHDRRFEVIAPFTELSW